MRSASLGRLGREPERRWAGGLGAQLRRDQVALRGDTEGTPLLELAPLRPAVEAVDLAQFVSAIVDFVVDANALSSRLWVAFVEAASSDAVLADACARQMADMRLQARRVLDDAVCRGLCRAPQDPSRAADAIWATLHPSQYDLLVALAGWTPGFYKTWLTSRVLHSCRPCDGGRPGRARGRQRPAVRPGSGRRHAELSAQAVSSAASPPS